MGSRYLLIAPPDSFARLMLPKFLAPDDELLAVTSPFDPKARAASFDAVMVLLDADDEEGAVICRTLKRLFLTPLVMLLTPQAREQLARGYRLGANAHIWLPCPPREFHARVAAARRRYALNAQRVLQAQRALLTKPQNSI